jgi:hypothetical protein
MARLVYLCERRGLPKLDQQRAALAGAGLTAEELAEAYIDHSLRKPAQPERDHMIGAAREGDEVWVSRPGVLATTEGEALRFAAAVSEHGAVLRVASTGAEYRIIPAVADALLLVAAIREDERRAVMEKARKGLRGKPAGKPKVSPERMEAARGYWFDATIDGDEAAKRAGIGRRTLHRHFGPRETPAFGLKRKGRK